MKDPDKIIQLVIDTHQAYWCKFCNRHIAPVKSQDGGLVFVHDNVYHLQDYVFDSGDIHTVN
jgi:hypothetical protein